MSSARKEQSDSRHETPHSPHSGDQMRANCGIIEVRLRESRQLFDALDPSPFHEKELGHHVEEWIIESAKEFPSGNACLLIIHLDQPDNTDESVVADAIRAHFKRRSGLLRRKLRQLLRRGLISLGIGMAFLTLFFVIAKVIGQLLGESNVATLFREGLIIVGWVAMWRPLEIFLYDWWPMLGERRLCDRLSAIQVQIVPAT